jgi:hypothetical protein
MYQPTSEPSAPFARSPWLSLAAAAAALTAALLWRFHEPGWGPIFWLWVLGMLGFVITFPPARSAAPRSSPTLWVLLSGVLLLAAWLRFPDIYDLPANISIDELLPGLESKLLADGVKPNPFGSVGWFTIPNFAFLPAAIVMKLSHLQAFHALRVSSAIVGLAGIVATFLLGRRLLGDRAALVAAIFMAAGFWHLHNSRTGFPFTQSSFGPPLVLYLILRAQQQHSQRGMALAGVAAGLILQLYFPVRILLILCPLFLLATYRSRHLRLLDAGRESAVFAAGLFLALAPLLINVGPETLTSHSSEILITRPAVLNELESRYRVSGFGAVLERNLWEATRMFSRRAEVAVLNLSPAGLLDQGTLAMFLAGLVLAALSGSAAPLLLLAWFLVTFLFGVALSNAPRGSYRLAAAMPAIYLLAAYAVDRGLAATGGARAWYRYSVRLPILFALAAWIVTENHRLFFAEYARGDGKPAPWPMAMRYMAARCDGRQFYVIPKSDTFGDADFLDLFCPAHRSADPTDIPLRIDTMRRATFLVMGQQLVALNALNRCYPDAVVTQHKNPEGIPLFTSVDVGIEELLAGQKRCGAVYGSGGRQPI